MSFLKFSLAGERRLHASTTTRDVLTDPTVLEVALDDVHDRTIGDDHHARDRAAARLLLAFRAGRWELLLLLSLVLADELNPLIRIYAWRMILGRSGIINWTLSPRAHRQPIDSLLFS